MKTGISFSSFGTDRSKLEILTAIKNAGFDSFFSGMDGGEKAIAELKEISLKLGLEYESLHAPFGGINCIWQDGEEGDIYTQKLCSVAKICAENEIGYFTLHCMNVPEFNVDVTEPMQLSAIGINRFGRIVEAAEKYGVKACFENVEFPHFELNALLSAFRKEGYRALGFTWDIGHEHCYPAPFDVACEFKDLLVGTHIHDNFGQKDVHTVTWNDDLHLLPFEGNINYADVASRLKRANYNGSITLEVFKKATEAQHNLTLEDYLCEAHRRAERIVKLCDSI